MNMDDIFLNLETSLVVAVLADLEGEEVEVGEL